MIYEHEYDGRVNAILSDAYVFEAVDLDNETPSKHYFTSHAAWDTGAEITIISPRVVKSLNLKSISQTKIMGIGGDEKVDVYKIHVGLPNDFLYENLIVYCGDIVLECLPKVPLTRLFERFIFAGRNNNNFC